MAKKGQAGTKPSTQPTAPPRAGKPSSLLDTRVVYCVYYDRDGVQ
jgi:hypothetical protein